VDHTFATELDRIPAEERAVVLDALQGALAWGHWNDLRTYGLSMDEATGTLRVTIRALLR
jgi:hypothetical protein